MSAFPKARDIARNSADQSDNIERWEKLPTNREGKDYRWSERLRRWYDANSESDHCVFCGREIDPDTAYHNTICRRCA
jgi:hypothetical protein